MPPEPEPLRESSSVDLLREFDLFASERRRLREALLGMVVLYRDDSGEIVHQPGASEADDAIAAAVAVLYPRGVNDAD